MTLDEYQERASETCTEISFNDTYLLLGLIAEVGELADKVAKAKRKGIVTISGDNILPAQLDPEGFTGFVGGFQKELGDVLWFVAMLAKHSGFTLEDIAEANLAKLADRKKRGVIIGEGDNR